MTRRVFARSGWLPAVALGALALLAVPERAAADTDKPVIQGEAPPDFTLPDSAGRQVRLSDFRGRVILLTFVSCHTDTCFAPMNAFEWLFEKHGRERLAAPTVCSEIPEALKADGFAGLRARCSAGQTLLIDETQQVSTRYFVTSFPTSLLIGPDFTVREIIQGVAGLRDPLLPGRIAELAKSVESRAPAR